MSRRAERRSAAAFRAPGSTHDRGRLAEEAAARWLAEAGYTVRERNVRTEPGEIDLVAVEGDTLCFVEVKARADEQCGSPLEAVTRRRQRRLARAAALYLAASGWPGPCRFDVLGLESGEEGWRFTLVRDAFDAEPT